MAPLQLEEVVLVGTSLGGHILGRLALDQLAGTAGDTGLRPRGLMLIGSLGLFPLEAAVAAAIRRSVVETTMDAISRKVAFVTTPSVPSEPMTTPSSASAERMLERRAEPLSALLLEPAHYPHAFLDTAWNLMIQNSAHDSSCACSNDEVVDDNVPLGEPALSVALAAQAFVKPTEVKSIITRAVMKVYAA